MVLLFIAVIVVASILLNTFGTLQGHGNCRPKILEDMQR
jgi:hypothetical protein